MAYLLCLALLAGMIAWVAKIAETRGRFAVGWALASAGIGCFAFAAGAVLLSPALDRDSSDGLAMLSIVLPPLVMIGAMAGLALLVTRLPIKTSSRPAWPVHDLTGHAGHDPGRLSLEPGALRIDFPGGPRVVPIETIRAVKADGECVRVSWDTDGNTTELTLLPCGKPDTPAGRKQQSRVVEKRVREHIAAGSVGALPAARVRV